MKRGHKDMRCGLIGEHLSHSFSPLIHSELADYSYTLCELAQDQLQAFLKQGTLDAFNVTIPYKKAIIPYLDSISAEASAIGSVNTVVKDKEGKLHGYNTDYFGFDYMIDISGIDVGAKKAVVFGRGGAALTVCAVLRDRGAKEIVTFGSRDNTPENIAKHADAEIIVNATPVGMYPNNATTPAKLSDFPACVGVLDLIFNPARTALLLDAEARRIPYINGLSMLVAQAAKAFEIFTGENFEEGCIERITSKIQKKTDNIILVGMPGSGKSTVGKIVADKLGRDFFDADNEFERMHGISPAKSIEQMGEERFRELENLTLAELGKKSGIVLATGGGAVTRDYNYPPLHQNGTIFFIERELKNLSRDGRPLSAKTTPEEMYAKRIDAYKRFADVTVYSNEIAEETADTIITEFNKRKGD